eukprot:CAMPEP_0113465140 /NCGR_PEP_ID=MMETSP0014_2-20120614/13578_1 /TAXON_ID=2857 /ORGANISM="Nitzschia sp." /LENGTH=369 /DNA_ID=CAMNT_0000357273 /DNA_START=274 /DNA_END=1383 /DNA_ORIENTATION=+ /assembly_acc=CAM_ASM_000159
MSSTATATDTCSSVPPQPMMMEISTSTSKTLLMDVLQVEKEGITHPFGDSRSVKQAFPAGIPSKLSDPFLMCDYFNAVERTGPATHPDDFPVNWHPHKGFDIASYLKKGTGRHGDSLGNRETYSTPGMQWMSTGSGVEHAEGGANDVGDLVQGFQIWINTPSSQKLKDPRYGTVPTTDLPLVSLVDDDEDGGTSVVSATARILAGQAVGASAGTTTADVVGPFRTSQDVQMIDFELKPSTTIDFDIARDMDTAMLYVYDGTLVATTENGMEEVEQGGIILFDADTDSNDRRGIKLTSGSARDNDVVGAHAILFAGKKIKEPIAWHGPIVLNTQDEIRETLKQLRSGDFPPKRVPWNYKRLQDFPDQKSS